MYASFGSVFPGFGFGVPAGFLIGFRDSHANISSYFSYHLQLHVEVWRIRGRRSAGGIAARPSSKHRKRRGFCAFAAFLVSASLVVGRCLLVVSVADVVVFVIVVVMAVVCCFCLWMRLSSLSLLLS